MVEVSPPSSWALERFGDAAQPLRRAIPAALQEAHRRALAAHLGSELETHDAYGVSLAVIQHLVMAEYLRAINGARTIRPPRSRYELVVISNNVVLYPGATQRTPRSRSAKARLRQPVSELRKDLLALGAEASPPESQLTFEQANIDESELLAEFEAEKAALAELAEYARLVVIAYASSPGAGVLRSLWGDAELQDETRGILTWHEKEPLPRTDPGFGTGDTKGGAPRPVRPSPHSQTLPGDGSTTRRWRSRRSASSHR